MKCIIVDDEPIARLGMKNLIEQVPQLKLLGSFNGAEQATEFIKNTEVDLIFLDIEMPGVNGIEFAKNITSYTLIIFTTAYSEYALDSYEVDAIDYLVKPIDPQRFEKAVNKAISYHSMLKGEKLDEIDSAKDDYMFVRSERRYFRVNFKDVLFVEGLKDYVIIHTEKQKIITKITLKEMELLLPSTLFFRVNRSYIVNLEKIDSFNNNDIYIQKHEIAIGISYRDEFFDIFTSKKIQL